MGSQKSAIIENAQQFAAKGKIDKAIAEWKKLIAETPQDGNIYNNISDLYLRVNDKASAIDACLKAAAVYREAGFELKGVAVLKKILKIDPNRIDIYEMLADISADRGLTGNAVEGYQQTAKLFMKAGNFKGAITVYQKLGRFTPDNPEIPLAIARLFQKQERNREAILAYEQAEAIYESKGMVTEARQIVEEIVKLDPSYLKQLVAKEAAVASIMDMGRERDITLSAPNKLAESLKFVRQDTQEKEESLFGEEMEVFRDLIPEEEGLIGARQAVSPPQKTVVEDVLSIEPPVVKKTPSDDKKEAMQKVSDIVINAHLSEADAYLRYGLNQNAIEKFLLVTELAPMREESYIRLQDVYLREGQKEQAAMIGFSLADIYEKKGEFNKQEALLRELHMIDPTGEYRKIAEEKKGNLQSVTSQPLSVVGGLPDSSLGPTQHEEISRLPDPVSDNAFQQAIREPDFEIFSEFPQLPRSPVSDLNAWEPAPAAPARESEKQEESFDLASAITEELGDISVNSFAAKKKGVGKVPSDSEGVVQDEKKQAYLETCYHLGIAQKEIGNFGKAIREFEQALEGQGRFQEVLSMLAGCYAEQGDLAQAAAVLQKGVNDPRSQGVTRLAISYELASVYAQLGEKDKSFSLYKEIYRVDPKFRDVSGKVKELPYRKPGSDNVRVKEAASFATEVAHVKEKPIAVVKEKRRVSYV